MAKIERRLTMLDTSCIIVGIIVGAGIFETAPEVARSQSTLLGLMAVWLFGGLLSLAGALCYAELATTYPYAGGDIVYLERAYGPWAGFLFGWANALIIRPGNIAAIAFAFARYAAMIYPGGKSQSGGILIAYAIGAVFVLTMLNVLGVKESTRAQNALVVAKVVGLLAVVAAALWGAPEVEMYSRSGSVTSPVLGLILVLFTFGGWNDVAYVAAEVEKPERNLFWSLVLGTSAVIGLYLLVNLAYTSTLGLAGVAASKAVATDTISVVFPKGAALLVAALICICTLGGTNGTIFTGSRIYYALGERVKVLSFLGNWSERFNTPAYALITQGLLTIPIILLAGSFSSSVVYTTTVVWLFFLATGISVFVLRWKEPETKRPNPVYLHPITTLAFCGSCVLLIWGAVDYDPKGSIASLLLLLSGIPVYLYSVKKSAKDNK